MGALDAFYTTWSQARTTFGEGAPTTGEASDGSARLREMQSTIESAAPDDRWQGTASQAYAAKNAEHAAVYGKLADLDQRMAAEVTNSASVVSAGRRNLGDLQRWVAAADASIPGGQSGDRMRMVLARKGLSQVSDTVQRSTEEMGVIGRRVDDIRKQYDAITGEGKKAAGWKENPPPVTPDDNRTHDEKVAEWFVKLNEWNQKVAKLRATRPPESAPEGVKIAWNEERRALAKEQADLAHEGVELGIEGAGVAPPVAQGAGPSNQPRLSGATGVPITPTANNVDMPRMRRL
ncbi:hypothetical protein GO011_27050 [Mycobacterium sp. 20091114027_K0903767]|nr:hypothetical protein [Mycobacterium sp. 20091114027_K0903767]